MLAARAHLDDFNRRIADGPRPQVLKQVTRLDAAKLNICRGGRGVRGLWGLAGARTFSLPRLCAPVLPKGDVEHRVRHLTCILVVPHQARLPDLHRGAGRAFAEVVKHKLQCNREGGEG